MTTHGGGGEYKDLVVFLAAAGVVVPLFNRLKISPVLGFLAAGVLLGPDGLARLADNAPWLAWLTISDANQIRSLSELGVAFLLFMIGLELSWERLRAMRKLVFGLGLTQVAVLRGSSVAQLRNHLPREHARKHVATTRPARRRSRQIGQVVAVRRSQRRARPAG